MAGGHKIAANRTRPRWQDSPSGAFHQRDLQRPIIEIFVEARKTLRAEAEFL